MKLSTFLTAVALAGAVALLTPASAADAAPAAPAAPPQPALRTFLVVLRLTPQYHAEDAWTETANATVRAHFVRLKEASERGQVILAGRTSETHDKTIGLVIFTAPDEAAARAFMNGDPCVVAGIMSGTVHPYSIALHHCP